MGVLCFDGSYHEMVFLSTRGLNRGENGMAFFGIPTLILFKDGREVDRVVGLVSRHVLCERLEAVLEGGTS